MNFLKWLMEEKKVDDKLSYYQLFTLLLINSSPTPELAAEIINKNSKLGNAINFLKKTRLISYNPTGYKCTVHGAQVLIYNGLLNDNYSLTPKGKKILNTRSEYL